MGLIDDLDPGGGLERRDDVLRAVGQTIVATVRSSDVAMRYGGEARRVEVPSKTRLDVAIEPLAGGIRRGHRHRCGWRP